MTGLGDAFYMQFYGVEIELEILEGADISDRVNGLHYLEYDARLNMERRARLCMFCLKDEDATPNWDTEAMANDKVAQNTTQKR